MSAEHAQPVDLERFRRYLLILAEAELAPRLRVKESPSDIVQQSLLEAHRDLPSFRGRSDAELVGWLKTILARNLLNVARHFRTAKCDIRLEQSLPESLEQSSARLDQWLSIDQSSPSQRAERNERVVALADALALLLDQERTAILLKHFRGWSLQEISEHIDRPVTAVAGLLKRGLKKLRDHLKALE